MPATIDIPRLTDVLRNNFPDIAFAYLFGSAKGGVVSDGSDVDTAIYYKGNEVFIRMQVAEALATVVGQHIPVDVVELQKAGTLLAFEAIRGNLLFVRDADMETYLHFYTLTCRKHEDEAYWMRKQLEYRGYEVQWRS